ncbi:P-type conjugative transfer protein TrbJ [Pseudomonas syringae]|uniref:P-type conjugative transfer protein TrbJ n=1 Tax=Pseudomonas syringae TaxID=317 RepID=UPI00273F133F|nr:P-type conjugative transfer protein TrbJ [Pseudomonas syringae]MDP5168590.1 P-type conjugative transfer protein TrbJ [Pseudomonas syringae pv. aptata str. DSM 50252]
MSSKASILAAKGFTSLAIASVLAFQPVFAGIPVADGLNLGQTTVTATNAVKQVTKQIEQYQTQLQQYENMLQNTVAPAAYVWDQANGVISKLVQAQDTLNYYKNQTGSIDNYLNRYQNVGYYRTSPCFTSDGCSESEMKAVQDGQADNSEAVKRANDAVLKGVDQQQQTLTTDAANLQKLQAQATNAKGQMEAIQAANQLASAQTNQLLQIRSVLTAQSAALATQAARENDKAAAEAAGDETFRSGGFTKSPPRNW